MQLPVKFVISIFLLQIMTIVQEAHVHQESAAELDQTSHLFVIVQGGYWRFLDILQCVQVF